MCPTLIGNFLLKLDLNNAFRFVVNEPELNQCTSSRSSHRILDVFFSFFLFILLLSHRWIGALRCVCFMDDDANKIVWIPIELVRIKPLIIGVKSIRFECRTSNAVKFQWICHQSIVCRLSFAWEHFFSLFFEIIIIWCLYNVKKIIIAFESVSEIEVPAERFFILYV